MPGEMSAGLIFFLIIHCLFFILGNRWALFSGIYFAFFILLILFLFRGQPKNGQMLSSFILLCGFLFYYAGLSLVGAMLRRSISLHAVYAVYKGRNPEGVIEEGIEKRVHEAQQLKFVKEDQGHLSLTPLGRIFGAVIGAFYKLYRIS